MSLPARLRSFVHSLLHRNTLESEMQTELSFHMESRAADLETTGLTPAEAMRQARIEFGPVATHKDGMRRALGLRWLDELRGDLLCLCLFYFTPETLGCPIHAASSHGWEVRLLTRQSKTHPAPPTPRSSPATHRASPQSATPT